MGGEVIDRAARGAPGKLRRKERRLAVRVDMTPMVDIAFLLLIFYMVTTVFQMPQAMEINLPPGDPVPIRECDLLTIRVDADGSHWWNICSVTPDNRPHLLPGRTETADFTACRVDPDTLRSLLIQRNRANSCLSTLVTIHRDADYADMVNILDEIEMVERVLNMSIARRLGVEVGRLSGDNRFSYRYALSEWEDRDSRIIADARRWLGMAVE